MIIMTIDFILRFFNNEMSSVAQMSIDFKKQFLKVFSTTETNSV